MAVFKLYRSSKTEDVSEVLAVTELSAGMQCSDGDEKPVSSGRERAVWLARKIGYEYCQVFGLPWVLSYRELIAGAKRHSHSQCLSPGSINGNTMCGNTSNSEKRPFLKHLFRGGEITGLPLIPGYI